MHLVCCDSNFVKIVAVSCICIMQVVSTIVFGTDGVILSLGVGGIVAIITPKAKSKAFSQSSSLSELLKSISGHSTDRVTIRGKGSKQGKP